jgi:hypothetical protein
VVTGIAGVDWRGSNNTDFDRDDLVFLVPDEANNPLVVSLGSQMSVIVYPATFEVRGGNTHG